ncbi:MULTISPECIES: signal recognition particle-docking protein FtsY [Hymenobacter]|uniref:Signal recognition particle receptor FtsY n=1 Tax=Hymenobacter jejuensis TaxID=2502781 RepID=A0A5B7ZZC0_9BACT|nr:MULTISPECIES: signal recognition particle-docking protein FtsY [Hymenobacter]MBC6991240.1 signal recognition particle-docking protein FtsY [Hymenobacter sp. BT491]QDA60388.1 signal recognition particle-docking protein FtsY [Hymenobacter jejuensis]
MGLFDFFKKDKESKEQQESLDKGLEKTKTSFFDQLSKAVVGKSKVDEEVLDDLESLLVHADVGIDTTVKVIDRIEKRVARDKYVGTGDLDRILREEIAALLEENNTGSAILDRPDNGEYTGPFVVMVVGVNGVGKTTTIGKLAHRFHSAGKKVVLGAADTFRAAAVDQLIVWGQRVGVQVISHGMNTDPASVAYDAVKRGVEMQADVVIIDTAGRLHNKVNLMNELTKIKRVMQKVIPDAPHEVLLVLDGSTGQNAFLQAKEFTKATEVSALAITKLDGTAKGGVVIGISDQFNIPVRYIGVGEKMTDLQLFDRHTYVNSLFSK